jgi:hypothetical protein
MIVDTFLNLRTATLQHDETPPPEADWAVIPDPPADLVEVRKAEGWFHVPKAVTYRRRTPSSIDEYLAAFRSHARRNIRTLMRKIHDRYELRRIQGVPHPDFGPLYSRMIAALPLGVDRVAERGVLADRRWIGLYLFEGSTLAAGVLCRRFRHHLSVAYGAFDPDRRGLDLEHGLIIETMNLAVEIGKPEVSLGQDTNRYGHHLSLKLPAYKLRIGFAPRANERIQRLLIKPLRFDRFPDGLFFYGFGDDDLIGHLFQSEPDPTPFQHPTAPRIESHPIV